MGFYKIHLADSRLDMWATKRWSRFSFFCLVLGCCTVLVLFSSRPKQNEEVQQNGYLAVRKSGIKRLEPHSHSPTFLPNAENTEETDETGLNKENIPRVIVSVLQKGFGFETGR